MTITLVTGATRGLGFEAARRLVAAGHTVHLGARNVARGERVAAARCRAPARGVVLEEHRRDVAPGAPAQPALGQLDLLESLQEAAATVQERSGGLDVLVNNAGIAGDQRPPSEASITDLRRVLETNVVGATAVLTVFAPLLDASASPVVVNVSSAVGSMTLNAEPDARWSMLAYPMSKAALNMLTIQYARAYPRWRVNSVTPGLTATEFAPTAGVGLPVEVGVEIIVRMACIDSDGPTGTFVDADGQVPW